MGINKNPLLFYSFDWDDNVLHMSTPIYLEQLVKGKWLPITVSTKQFANCRTDSSYRLVNNDLQQSFSNFRDDGPKGNKSFLEDVKKALNQKSYGPVWLDFIECITNSCIFSIITARGHSSTSIRKGIEWIIKNELSKEQLEIFYNNLAEKFQQSEPNKNLLESYLDLCDFVGVSQAKTKYACLPTEKAKEFAFLDFVFRVNKIAEDLKTSAKIGFSDDDSKNLAYIEIFIKNLDMNSLSNIQHIVLKNTSNPLQIIKKVTEFPVLF